MIWRRRLPPPIPSAYLGPLLYSPAVLELDIYTLPETRDPRGAKVLRLSLPGNLRPGLQIWSSQMIDPQPHKGAKELRGLADARAQLPGPGVSGLASVSAEAAIARSAARR